MADAHTRNALTAVRPRTWVAIYEPPAGFNQVVAAGPDKAIGAEKERGQTSEFNAAPHATIVRTIGHILSVFRECAEALHGLSRKLSGLRSPLRTHTSAAGVHYSAVRADASGSPTSTLRTVTPRVLPSSALLEGYPIASHRRRPNPQGSPPRFRVAPGRARNAQAAIHDLGRTPHSLKLRLGGAALANMKQTRNGEMFPGHPPRAALASMTGMVAAALARVASQCVPALRISLPAPGGSIPVATARGRKLSVPVAIAGEFAISHLSDMSGKRPGARSLRHPVAPNGVSKASWTAGNGMASSAAKALLPGLPLASVAAPPRSISAATAGATGFFTNVNTSPNPAVVVRYSPNLVIHAPQSTDDEALEHRVRAVLERHGRQLHHVLTRELTRERRTEF